MCAQAAALCLSRRARLHADLGAVERGSLVLRPWYLQPEGSRIKVSHSGQIDTLSPTDQAEYHELVGKEVDEFKEYTYCSLEVG